MRFSKESGVASVAALIAVSAVMVSWRSSRAALPATAVVLRRDFSDAIIETGTVSTEHVRLYGSQITGTTVKLIDLVPEGTTVAAGDAVARFDVSALILIRDRARAELNQAEAEIRRAEAEAEIDSLRSQTDLDAAARQSDTARRALANQAHGKSIVDLAAAKAALNDAARELTSTQSTADDMARLLKEGFVTRVEVERAEQVLQRAHDQHALAMTRLEALVKFEAPASLSRAEADAQAAASNVARQQSAVTARGRERDAEVAMAMSRRDQLRLNIASLTEQIDHGVLRAEAPGMVIFRELYFGGDHRKPQIGDEIVAGQPLIAIPDFSAVTVDTSVREVDLHRISTSRRVSVRVDAYPDAVFDGAVSFVGALAQPDDARAGGKFFPVTVALASSDPRLRSGMTARVEIVVSTLASALLVPVISVFDDGHGPFVLVDRGPGHPERRSVAVAADNGSFAAITSGIAEGERVLLTDPSAAVKR
jgi:multidrug efflux pump subunit AcrA (membrane-fusion protein)